jgi:hypothetical protein
MTLFVAVEPLNSQHSHHVYVHYAVQDWLGAVWRNMQTTRGEASSHAASLEVCNCLSKQSFIVNAAWWDMTDYQLALYFLMPKRWTMHTEWQNC